MEIIKSETVGIYDVQVVKSEQSRELTQWLNRHGFQFTRSDTEIFDRYIKRGWCFVVAKSDPSAETGKGEIGMEGMVAPLILRFSTEDPVYPLALTSIVGSETQVLLYVWSTKKMQTDGRLDLEFAEELGAYSFGVITEMVKPEGFFKEDEPTYLCKFKGTLTPSQMAEDLVLTYAGDNKPYRRHMIIW